MTTASTLLSTCSAGISELTDLTLTAGGHVRTDVAAEVTSLHAQLDANDAELQSAAAAFAVHWRQSVESALDALRADRAAALAARLTALIPEAFGAGTRMRERLVLFCFDHHLWGRLVDLADADVADAAALLELRALERQFVAQLFARLGVNHVVVDASRGDESGPSVAVHEVSCEPDLHSWPVIVYDAENKVSVTTMVEARARALPAALQTPSPSASPSLAAAAASPALQTPPAAVSPPLELPSDTVLANSRNHAAQVFLALVGAGTARAAKHFWTLPTATNGVFPMPSLMLVRRAPSPPPPP